MSSKMFTKNVDKNVKKNLVVYKMFLLELSKKIVFENSSLCYSFLNFLGSNISKLSNGRCGQVVVTPSSEDLEKSCLAKGGHHMLSNF